MDWCVTFPREALLTYRPSLRKACGGNRNAAKFLSYLLYRASIREEAKIEAHHINEVRRSRGQEANQDESIDVCRTQKQIVEEMDEEISSRTLRDEAVPCLEELGYISTQEVRGNKQYTVYTVYPQIIQAGINHPENIPNFKMMKYSKPSGNFSERKNFRAEKTPNGSEKFPNDLSTASGKISERKNTNNDASQADLDGTFETPKNIRENNKNDSANALSPTTVTQKVETPSPIAEGTTKKQTSSKQKNIVQIQDALAMTPDEQAIVANWQSLFKTPIPVTPKLIAAAKQLVPCHPTREQLSQVRRFAYVINPAWHVNKRVSVTLQHVANYWEQWAAQEDIPGILAEDQTASDTFNKPVDQQRLISRFAAPDFYEQRRANTVGI